MKESDNPTAYHLVGFIRLVTGKYCSEIELAREYSPKSHARLTARYSQLFFRVCRLLGFYSYDMLKMLREMLEEELKRMSEGKTDEG